MLEVLAASVAFPTVVFTALLAVSLAYWVFVLVGAVDLDGGDAEGAAKGMLEGSVKGAMEGSVKGAAEAAVGGESHGHDGVDGGGEVHAGSESSLLALLLGALGFHRAPATLILSLFSLFGWLSSTLGSLLLHHATGQPLAWLERLGIFAASLVVALVGASVVSRPVAPLFRVRNAQKRTQLVGQIAVVSTGRVDGRFGQARLENGGAELILEVRHGADRLGTTGGELRRGDRVLILGWDDERDAFEVELMDVGPRRVAEPLADALAEPPGEGRREPSRQEPSR